MTTSRTFVAALAALVVVGGWTTANAQDATDPDRRVRGSLRAGTEYDDNVFRAEGDEKEGGFLSRYFATLDLAAHGPAASVGSLSISHGGKFFFVDEQGVADTLLTQIAVGYRQRLVQPLALWASANMKDRTERVSLRDYNLGGAGGGIEFYVGPITARLGAAWRYFAFKPNSESSSSNGEALGVLRWEIIESFDASLGYTLARRSFDTDRYRLEGEEIAAVADDPRRDAYHVGFVALSFTGPVVAETRYSYALNASNSYGQDLVRHSFDLTVTAPLPWRLFASGHVELQRTTYQDAVLRDATFQIDEDNRNAFVASLARALGENWEVEGRYSLYLQEFGVDDESYRRMTFMLAAGYVFD